MLFCWSLLKSILTWAFEQKRRLLPKCILLTLPYHITEPEPESTDPAAKVLWTVLCSVRGEEHSGSSDEQHPAPSSENAPKIWPERFYLQTPGIQEGEREVQPHIQRPGLHTGHAWGANAGCRHLQCTGENTAARLSGKEEANWECQTIATMHTEKLIF